MVLVETHRFWIRFVEVTPASIVLPTLRVPLTNWVCNTKDELGTTPKGQRMSLRFCTRPISFLF